MEMNFYRRCGSKLTNVDRHVFRCDNGHVIFANASPTIGVLFLTEDNKRLILAVRGEEPNKGMLDAFGDFTDSAESFEAAGTKIVGLHSLDLALLHSDDIRAAIYALRKLFPEQPAT